MEAESKFFHTKFILALWRHFRKMLSSRKKELMKMSWSIDFDGELMAMILIDQHVFFKALGFFFSCFLILTCILKQL